MTDLSHNPKLIIISGLPGTGKTRLSQALASHFQIPLFSKDRLQSRLRAQNLASRNTVDGYLLILDLAEQQLSLGVSAILDGVFPLNGFRQHAAEMAQRHHASFRPTHCLCSDLALWQKRLKTREQNIPDWTPVGWDEVQRLQPEYLPWEKSTTLFLDAVDPFNENLVKAIDWAGAG